MSYITESAFPYVETGECSVTSGMTLLDYFAAKAMQSYVRVSPGRFEKEHAAASYRMASLMLEERKKYDNR